LGGAYVRGGALFDQGQTPTVCLVNRARTPLPVPLDVQARLVQAFLDRCFSPVWGRHAEVREADHVCAGCWAVVYVDDPVDAHVLGYHEYTAEGLPISRVSVHAAEKVEGGLTEIVAHETGEMLVNPGLHLLSEGPDGVTAYLEVSDPVSGTRFELEDFPGLALPNFVYPAYFEDFRAPRSRRFDFLGLVERPFEILREGYLPVRRAGMVVNVFGSLAGRDGYLPAAHSRIARLVKGRDSWRLSDPRTTPELYDETEGCDMAKKVTPKPTPIKPAAKAPAPEPELEEVGHAAEPDEEEEVGGGEEEEGGEGEGGGEEGGEGEGEEGGEESGGEESGGEFEESPEQVPQEVAHYAEQVQAMGLDWHRISTAVGLFGPPVIQLAQTLLDHGFTAEAVQEAIEKYDPQLTKLVMDWFQHRAGSDQDGSGVQDSAEPEPGFGEHGLMAADAGQRQEEVQQGVMDFMLDKYLITPLVAKLPPSVGGFVEQHKAEWLGWLSKILASQTGF
jgi:hypothetical protein